MGGFPSPRDDIREAAQEQHEYLNHALLIELWPHLHLDVRIIAAWENTFDSLRGKQMGAHPHRTHALGGIAFLSHRSARHQPPYAGDSGTREPLSATLGSRGLLDRTRWWGQFQVLRHGWTSSFPQITSSASQVALWTHLRAG